MRVGYYLAPDRCASHRVNNVCTLQELRKGGDRGRKGRLSGGGGRSWSEPLDLGCRVKRGRLLPPKFQFHRLTPPVSFFFFLRRSASLLLFPSANCQPWKLSCWKKQKHFSFHPLFLWSAIAKNRKIQMNQKREMIEWNFFLSVKSPAAYFTSVCFADAKIQQVSFIIVFLSFLHL